jgi:hypothetical protein
MGDDSIDMEDDSIDMGYLVNLVRPRHDGLAGEAQRVLLVEQPQGRGLHSFPLSST